MKRVRKSKTISLNGLALLGLFCPGAEAWISGHPKQVVGAALIANMVLRFVSHDKIQLEIPQMIKGKLKFLLPIFVLVACSSFPVDTSVQAAQAKSNTVIFTGMGQMARKGYLYAEKPIGALPSDDLWMTFQGADCDRDSCIRYQFFRPDGSQGFAGSVPKGQSQAHLKLSDILGKETPLTAQDDHEYQVWTQTIFKAPDGHEYSMVARGIVRVVVTDPQFFNVACNDNSIAWKTRITGNCEAQFTTSYRSVVCGEGCE